MLRQPVVIALFAGQGEISKASPLLLPVEKVLLIEPVERRHYGGVGQGAAQVIADFSHGSTSGFADEVQYFTFERTEKQEFERISKPAGICHDDTGCTVDLIMRLRRIRMEAKDAIRIRRKQISMKTFSPSSRSARPVLSSESVKTPWMKSKTAAG
jgi:hypothetical protein